MVEQVVKGSNIIYSLLYMNEDDILLIQNCPKYHEILGYILYDSEESIYNFYSIEDNYTNAIVNHWTTPIVKNYDNNSCWLVIKAHPCKLYNILADIYEGNRICNVYNFDIWKNHNNNYLVGVINDIEID